jgi:hypothetical protein
MKTEGSILNPFVPCSASIFLDSEHKSNTYCLREHGHSGEHNTVNEEPKKKEA